MPVFSIKFIILFHTPPCLENLLNPDGKLLLHLASKLFYIVSAIPFLIRHFMRKMLKQNLTGPVYDTDSQRQIVEEHSNPFFHPSQSDLAEQEQQQQQADCSQDRNDLDLITGNEIHRGIRQFCSRRKPLWINTGSLQ